MIKKGFKFCKTLRNFRNGSLSVNGEEKGVEEEILADKSY